eukprot:gene5865-15897_t
MITRVANKNRDLWENEIPDTKPLKKPPKNLDTLGKQTQLQNKKPSKMLSMFYKARLRLWLPSILLSHMTSPHPTRILLLTSPVPQYNPRAALCT